MDLWTEIGSLSYLFLRSMSEPRDNVLRLILQEGRVAEETHDLQIGQAVLADVQDISSPPDSAVYEVVFTHYVAYSVRNESFTAMDDDERYEGQRCRVYSHSKFLDYVAAATIASDDYPGRYVHYGLVCENHIIDVAAVTRPEVTRVGGAA